MHEYTSYAPRSLCHVSFIGLGVELPHVRISCYYEPQTGAALNESRHKKTSNDFTICNVDITIFELVTLWHEPNHQMIIYESNIW